MDKSTHFFGQPLNPIDQVYSSGGSFGELRQWGEFAVDAMVNVDCFLGTHHSGAVVGVNQLTETSLALKHLQHH